jgi:hypothetical protein
MSKSTPHGRQLLRDERRPRHLRITDLTGQTARCFKTGLYNAAAVMQFIELDTWAYLMRPREMTKHGRGSFTWFVNKYLRGDPGQKYQYEATDVYAARCGMLHTGGAVSDLHHSDHSIVLWRFHLGQLHTYVPGTKDMAYISLHRFHMDCVAAVPKCLDELRPNPIVGELFSRRLRRVYHQAGILPSRDPDAIALIDPDIDALLARLNPT